MSYPQPSSIDYVINGFEFFRLNTLLSSPGDIYESNVGSLALAVGPQSDIANVNVAYFDSQVVPTFMQFTIISPLRAFVGRVDAQPGLTYSPAQRPGRILFWSDDIFDPNFRPRAFIPETDTIQFVQPRLDVIQYFTNQPSLTPARSDTEYVFQNYGAGNTFYLVLPYYGRKYCYAEFTNRSPTGVPNTYGISTVNYAMTQDTGEVIPNPYHQETVIRTPAAVAAGATVTTIITSTSTGMFDGLVFSFTDLGPAPLRITMSDRAI